MPSTKEQELEIFIHNIQLDAIDIYKEFYGLNRAGDFAKKLSKNRADTTTNLKSLLDNAEREARFIEAGLWLQEVVRQDRSRLDTNEWYKLNPKDISKFWAERKEALQKGSEE